MPGVAALVNHLVPDGKSIQLFYNTNDLNLGLELKDGTADGDDPNRKFVAKSTDRQGIIVNPSQAAATEFLGMNLVFGITQPVLPKDQTDYTVYNVSIVSPVYRPLTTTEVSNKSIAACSSDKKAWVYYLAGTDADSIELKEYRLEDYAIDVHSGTTKILKGSSLAAYWGPKSNSKKRRFVIYQGKSSSDLYEYCVEDDEVHHIRSSADARNGTTIAVIFVSGKAYLYYTNSSRNIRKIVKGSDGKWGSSNRLDDGAEDASSRLGALKLDASSQLEDALKVDVSSQLTVTTSNGINHLFYVPSGGAEGEFTHIRDPIDS